MNLSDEEREALLGHDEACRAFDAAFERQDYQQALRCAIKAAEWLQKATTIRTQRLEHGDDPSEAA